MIPLYIFQSKHITDWNGFRVKVGEAVPQEAMISSVIQSKTIAGKGRREEGDTAVAKCCHENKSSSPLSPLYKICIL